MLSILLIVVLISFYSEAPQPDLGNSDHPNPRTSGSDTRCLASPNGDRVPTPTFPDNGDDPMYGMPHIPNPDGDQSSHCDPGTPLVPSDDDELLEEPSCSDDDDSSPSNLVPETGDVPENHVIPPQSFVLAHIPKPPGSNNSTACPLTFQDVNVNEIIDLPYSTTNCEELRLAMQYIPLLRNASLDDSDLDEEDIAKLRNPKPCRVNLEKDFDTKLSLDLFLALQTYPDTVYSKIIAILNKALPDLSLLSLYRIKCHARNLAGVATTKYDMCPNSCIAYTGPLLNENKCYVCKESRWDPKYVGKKVAAAKFTTLTVGTQLQALYSSPESAQLMCYRREKTKPLLEKIQNGIEMHFDTYDDIFTSFDYYDLVKSGAVNDKSILLMLSMDGAQLYKHRSSDCWMIIWVILELSPSLRYKKCYVLPAGFIPGPGKPKNLDTFLFPGLHHISALQKDGLKVWDAFEGQIVTKRPQVYISTADAPGMADMSGVIGYKGAKGCRNYCTVQTRHLQGAPHYYPVLRLPSGNMPRGSNHGDVDLKVMNPFHSQHEYNTNVTNLLKSFTGNKFDEQRKLTGLTKPSIFNGLCNPTLGAPGAFPVDIMHLFFLGLWKGPFRKAGDLRVGDDIPSEWTWRVLVGATWKAHGAQVASLRPYLPYTYERPPRNPAEKINSGYKAAEYNVYFWGYLPALLRGVLPEPFYGNFCKLVRFVRLMSQREIQSCDLDEAQVLITDFLDEYEEIYVDRRQSMLQFLNI